MKQVLSFVLTLTLLCGCLALTAQAQTGFMDVHCGEQGFSTKIPADLSAYWEEGTGLRISVGTPGYVPYVAVYRRPEKLSNPVNYLNNVYREYMENRYDNNVGTNPCREYEIGGKTLYGAQYHYEASGNKLCLVLLIETRDDGDVEYYGKFLEGKGDPVMNVLDTAVRYYQPDGAEGAGGTDSAADLVAVRCDEQGYSTRMPAGLSSTWQEGSGLRIWVGEAGYVPNVQIWRRPKKLNDPQNYVKNVYADHMKETYGENLISTTQYEYYETGGKRLLGGGYIYRGASSGVAINLLHLVEARDDGDVEYFVRYLNDQREATLAALDAAVRYYQPDAEAAQPQAAAPQSQTAARQLNVKAAEPIVSGTTQYSDGRFSMQLPTGWQIMTEGEYMTFAFTAWDMRNPNRTLFMFLKLEPFLKSQAAKQKYQEVNNSLGGNSLYQIYANAPVMESCTLKGFLDAIPQVRAFCDLFYDAGLTMNPSIFPNMTNVEIVESTPSSLPAPDICKENVIARITYSDYLGQPCEGLVTAQPVDMMRYDFFGVDGWTYTVYVFMGVTAPIGELTELEPVLTECLSTFSFEQRYVNQAINLSNEETKALLARGEAMQAAHDAMVNAWYAREAAHDIAFQKWSDSFMGYDRLYDSSTGEVYLADLGFYDSYDLHRYEYNNSNLQMVDSRTEQYYLQSADYYISR